MRVQHQEKHVQTQARLCRVREGGQAVERGVNVWRALDLRHSGHDVGAEVEDRAGQGRVGREEGHDTDSHLAAQAGQLRDVIR